MTTEQTTLLGADDAVRHHITSPSSPTPILIAVYKGNFETLIALLKKNVHQYLNIKNLKLERLTTQLKQDEHTANLVYFENGNLKKWLSEKGQQAAPRMRALVELMLFKHELKNELKISKSSDVFKNPENPTVKNRACDALFDVVIGKRTASTLDELSSAEKEILKGAKNPLASIYDDLFDEIEKRREEEALAQTRTSSVNLDVVD